MVGLLYQVHFAMQSEKVQYPTIQQHWGFNGQAVVNHAVHGTALKVGPDSQASQRVSSGGGFSAELLLEHFQAIQKDKILSGTQALSHLVL